MGTDRGMTHVTHTVFPAVSDSNTRVMISPGLLKGGRMFKLEFLILRSNPDQFHLCYL